MKQWIFAVVTSSQQNDTKKNLFRQSKQDAVRFACVSLFALFLMFFDYHYASLQWVRRGFTLFVAPLQYVVDYPLRCLDALQAILQSKKNLIDDNMRLQYEHTLLESKLQQLLAIQEENANLKALLSTASHAEFKTMAAKILAVDVDLARQLLIINKGKYDGVFLGQPVLDAAGVMGQIIDVGHTTSTVLLISDPKCAVPVRNIRSGEQAIVEGTANPKSLALIHLPLTSDIRKGDLMVTSGLGRLYPEGFPVGHVTLVERIPGDEFMRVAVSPIAKLSRNRLVLLIWPDAQSLQMTHQIQQRFDNVRKMT